MNLPEDPETEKAIRVLNARRRLIRNAVIWTPLAVVSLAAFLFFAGDQLFTGGEHGATWFLVVLLAVFLFLFGFQASQALLDLLGKVEEASAEVTRRWSRTDSFVMRSHYIRLDNSKILHVDALLNAEIHEGDHLKVAYYPHSAFAVWVEKLPPPESTP